MEILYLEGTEDTPKIILDAGKGIFEISGRSLPEDAAKFYAPTLEWIKAYSKNPNPTTNLIFKLDYFNTGSSKRILDILSVLEHIKSMKVMWYFHDDDEDMEESGQEFSELVKIPFEFKLY